MNQIKVIYTNGSVKMYDTPAREIDAYQKAYDFGYFSQVVAVFYKDYAFVDFGF